MGLAEITFEENRSNLVRHPSSPVGDAASGGHGLLSHVGPSQGYPPARFSRQFEHAYGAMPFLQAGLGKVGDACAVQRWRFRRATGPNSRRRGVVQEVLRCPPEQRFQATKDLAKSGDLLEVTDHPGLEVINGGVRVRNRMILAGFDWRRLIFMYLDLVGEVPVIWDLGRVSRRTPKGIPVMGWPVPPSWCIETPSPSSPYYVFQKDSWTVQVPEEWVTIFRNPDPANPYGRGTSISRALAHELELSEYATIHLASWFRNRCIPHVIISGPRLSPDKAAVKRLERRLIQKHQGVGKGFQPDFLADDIKVHRMDTKFQEMEVAGLRTQARDTTLECLSLPKLLFGIGDSSDRSASDLADFHMAKQVVLPRCERFRDYLQYDLIPRYPGNAGEVIVDCDSPIREDREFRLKAARAQPQAFRQNEWRELAGTEPVEGGDVHLVPKRFEAIERLDEVTLDQPQAAAPTKSPRAKDLSLVTKMAPEPLRDDVRKDLLRALQAVMSAGEAPIRAGFLAAVARVQAAVDLEALEVALERSDLAAAMDAIPLESFEGGLVALQEPLVEVFVDAVGVGILHLPEELQALAGFQGARTSAEIWAREAVGELITQVTPSTQNAIRQIIGDSFSDSFTRRLSAREIRAFIGLDSGRAREFRAFVAETLASPGIPADLAGRMLRDEYGRLLDARALSIAHTETINAGAEGQIRAWRNAENVGAITAGEWEEEWVALILGVCPTCEGLDGQRVPIGGVFTTTAGRGFTGRRPTAHTECRCQLALRKVAA